MKKFHFALVAIAACLASPALSIAGLVTGVSFSGPGGTGVDGGTFSNVTEPRLFYSSIDYIDVTVTVDSAGSYLVNEAPGLGFILNNTGVHWTAFQIENLTPEVGAMSGWSYYTSPFSTILNTPNLVIASGGAGIATATSLAMFGDYITTTGPATFVLRQTPIVPEPATALLGALGMLSFGAVCVVKRFRRK